MVMASFGVARTTDSTFLSIFTLLAEKWALQQTPLHIFLLVIQAPFATVNHLLMAWRLMWIPPLKKKCT